jgi:hypothetical protein
MTSPLSGTFRTTAALALTSALLFTAGCATSPGSGGTSASAPAAEARTTTPVRVPAAAAKRVVLVMTGTKQVVEAKDWGDFKREWRETFAEHAKDAGVTFSMADTPPPAGSGDGTLLLVNVADYRIVGIGSRVFFGAMTGNAFINAQIRWSSLRSGAPFGEQQVNTSSSAWHGVFAKVTPQQVDAIAQEVFLDLKAAR